MYNSGTQYKLHVDSKGQLWYTVGQYMPVPVGMTVETFIQNNPLSTQDEVIAVGSRSNSKLLLELFELKNKNKFKSLKVCSPVSCSGEKRRQDPRIVLLDIENLRELPGSLGGFHEFHQTDLYSYLLASQTTEEHLINALKIHPVWPYLQFIPHLNVLKCAQVVGGLIDPRWYIDPDDPESPSRVQGYLGLNPETQMSLSDLCEPRIFVQERCKLVLDAWKTEEPTEEELAKPGYFLWRIFHSSGNKDHLSELRASQMFITYLKETWLHAIYRKNGGVSADGLFVPEHFFKLKEESESYREFLKI